MKKKAAEALQKLLKQARADLAEAKKNKDKHALKVKSIGIHNTYRDPPSEKKNYVSAFGIQYRNFLSKKYKNIKDRHSSKAVTVMAKHMNGVKAPVGFSNHTSGIAVDFQTKEDGLGTLGPNTYQSITWTKSWLYEWLGKNDSKYNFKRLKTEQWHWDYTGKL